MAIPDASFSVLWSAAIPYVVCSTIGLLKSHPQWRQLVAGTWTATFCHQCRRAISDSYASCFSSAELYF